MHKHKRYPDYAGETILPTLREGSREGTKIQTISWVIQKLTRHDPNHAGKTTVSNACHDPSYAQLNHASTKEYNIQYVPYLMFNIYRYVWVQEIWTEAEVARSMIAV